MSAALVSGQTARQPMAAPAANAVARTQSAPQPRPLVAKSPATAPDFAAERKLVDQYCVTCHNARLKTADLLLDQLDLAHIGRPCGNRRKSRPQASRRHDAADGHAAARSGDARVVHPLDGERTRSQRAARHLPPPGLHRLNRTEYANAIRDLLGLEVDATKFLPADDSTRGFDNIAGALTHVAGA